MWNKIKQFFSEVWQKVKPYIGYIGAFLAGLIGVILLGKKNTPKASDELEKEQEIRDKKAEEITKDTEQILNDIDQKIKDYYEKKNERMNE